ncbi:protein Red-like isoform X4 [Mauremys mutica]|uniref:protein Red-like isoform X4 n=1 Tax=Mauremys mutica TaxID=74926 RepID=UPI001D15F89C|nr:protein Red-like isoform X4 [Mauremys mutica]
MAAPREGSWRQPWRRRKMQDTCSMDDMAVDSDEEVDYSKMDQGNKKGPLGRWDFDTQEEYSEYMNNKEALPKAAFQYGIKMSEGRKTRRFKETNDKAELDRQWKKISAGGGEETEVLTSQPSSCVSSLEPLGL